ncbi:MAG: response regulator transcription factor [Chloroflexi bacterium]|nr:response regulator transcription factor [Chloroflexota bacterium]
MSAKILIIDDDAALAKTIERVLLDAGYTAVIAHTTEDGIHLTLTEQPDLILLDVMVPSQGGWTACQQIRRFSEAPIIFLTALDAVENIVCGLEMGADDYIAKPFDQDELLARVMAHLRRGQADASAAQKYEFNDGALIIDIPAHVVTINGEAVELTPREFDLLLALATNAGQVVSTAELVQRAWGYTDQDALDNIKTYIHYLRKKIEDDPASPYWIRTVRGIGYRFTI